MQALRTFGIFVILFLPFALFAQEPNTDDAAKEQQRRLTAIIEQALSDIQTLRLPENRAFFSCQAGNLLWQQDEGRARTLFQNAAADLIAAQNAAEAKRRSNPNNELLNGGNTRQGILNIIASRDAELALDLLVKTRPLSIQRAMNPDNQSDTKIGNYSRGNNYLAQNESYMEQNFYRLAAEQSPDRAAKLLKESLSKGLTNETYNQLTRLAEKDQVAAASMGSKVISKLMQDSYMADGQPLYVNIQLTNTIISHFMSGQNGSDKKLKFDDGQVHDLASKLIAAFISDPKVGPYIGQPVIQIAEKFSPSTVDAVKKASSHIFTQGERNETDLAFQKLMESDTPPEQMLAAASKFSLDSRRQIYQSASNKFMGRGDTKAARDVLSENFTDDARDQMLNNFDMQNAYNLIGQGKFAEAEQVIDGLPEEQRVPALVNLANSVFGRDQKENKTYALALLTKAGQLTNEKPENSSEMSMLTQVIAGYSNIDPAEAIRIFEGLVPKINELSDAAAVINGFQNGSNVREGEFVISQGDPFYSYGANPSLIGPLAKFDFDRTMRLIDSFSRQEMRISLRLKLAENNGGRLITSLPLQGRGFSIGFSRN